MNIAVTGAAGFIGSRLCYYLHERGYKVIALVRSMEKGHLLNEMGISIRIADITDRNTLYKSFEDVHVVMHLAALFNNPEASLNDYLKVNVEGTENVFNVALEVGVKRVVHCSTGGVATGFGNSPFSEKTPYSHPEWDKYETTKCEGEKKALSFTKRDGIEVVVIRPAQVYGPGDRSKVKFYRLVKKGVIINPGKTKKHLIYIDDLCSAFEKAIFCHNCIGESIIVGNYRPIELKEYIALVAEILNVPLPKIILPAFPITILCIMTEKLFNFVRVKPPIFRRSMDFFTKSVEFDVTKAKKILNFESQIDVKEGINKTVTWYKNYGLL
jgi:nucleoside-diphosphate-sugar epimerase